MLFSNLIILFHSKLNSSKKEKYWKKIFIDKDPEKYILDKLHFDNLLRASMIKYEEKNFLLTIYEHNFIISKGHADFWGLDLSYVDDVKNDVWLRDKGTCQKCGKELTKIIDYFNEIVEEIHSLKEMEIYKWERCCWKCEKKTPRVSYYIEVNFNYHIGDIQKIDEILMKKYHFINKKFSYTQGEKVIASVKSTLCYIDRFYYIKIVITI